MKNGLLVPPDSAIFNGTMADINTAFGGLLNTRKSTPQGQLATSLAAIISDKNAQLIKQVNNCDPAFSSGRMQDAIGRIYFIDRIPGKGTIVIAQCIGEQGTVIPAGTYALDTSYNLYASTTAATIGSTGSVDVTFQGVAYGPISCPAGTLISPYKTILGWDRITNAEDGTPGRLVETAAEFEQRRFHSVAINACGTLPAIKAAVLCVPGVTDCYVTENDTPGPVTIGDYTLAPQSIYVAAIGGNSNDIAQALWSKKAPGCAYNGNTAVTVFDDSSYYAQPYPSYQVLFQRPTFSPIFMTITLNSTVSVPSDAATQIANIVLRAFAGNDGGTRATMGSLLFASRYYASILALGNWPEIITFKLGRSAIDLNDSILLNIDEMPTLTAANINVVIANA